MAPLNHWMAPAIFVSATPFCVLESSCVRYLMISRSFGPIVVPADHYLMLGDNRDNSMDSRFFGLVSRELLIGRAERILVSADYKGSWAPRFDRFGKSLY